jgi:hypothetical protein
MCAFMTAPLGGHFGSSVNLDTLCGGVQWVTNQPDVERYPFWLALV